MASPLQIQIALHYWTRRTPYALHEPEHACSPAVRDALQYFIAKEMLVLEGDGYAATDAMRVWVDGLCAVPMPVKVWTLPKNPE